jgi:hypothetical protein
MHHERNRFIKELSKSLAKWKRDAETWYKQDTALFESLLHKVEANVVCVSRIRDNHYLFCIGERR